MIQIPYLTQGLGVALVLSLAWGAYERDGWQRSERKYLTLKNAHLEDANKTWKKVGEAQENFDAQVAEGLAKLNDKRREVEGAYDAYMAAVLRSSSGKIPLAPDELSALKLLGGQTAGNSPGGSTVRATQPPAPVR